MEKYTDTIWTYHDYCALPADGKIYQIIKGVMYMVPAPIPNHQDLVGNIYSILRSHVQKNNLGKVYISPIDVIFSQTSVVQPDVLYISKNRKAIIGEKAIFGAPDLIVEVVSPSTRKLDETTKKELYEFQGVIEYLIVYPDEKKVVHYVLEGGFYRLRGTFVSPEEIPLKTLSMSLPLRDVFEV